MRKVGIVARSVQLTVMSLGTLGPAERGPRLGRVHVLGVTERPVAERVVQQAPNLLEAALDSMIDYVQAFHVDPV